MAQGTTEKGGVCLMAELLLYRGPHWMDALSEAEVVEYEKNNPGFTAKYNRRLQTGDVIEVGPDGKWKNPYRFIHIKMPGVDPKDMAHLIERDYIGETDPDKTVIAPTVRHRKRYNFQVDLLDPADVQKVEQKKPVTLNQAAFLSATVDKSL